ncbi:hypothetical protein [Holdemania massiliensis]|uniref:hypothetical protein n=1 Tax=Holdemania massiliensis TaxID=1468449 RepID=UPI001F064D20|nr:hypothetical protein [Holdemania massiliensis]MCH1942427.1 hypothetical protein [Holdemania massiliensis]
MKKTGILILMLLLISGCSNKKLEAVLPEDKLVEYGDDLVNRVTTETEGVEVTAVIQDLEGNEKQYTPDEIELYTDYKIIYTLTKGSKTITEEETIQFQDTTPPTIKFLGKNNRITLKAPLHENEKWEEIKSYFEYSDNYKMLSNGSPLRFECDGSVREGSTIGCEVYALDEYSDSGSERLNITIIALEKEQVPVELPENKIVKLGTDLKTRVTTVEGAEVMYVLYYMDGSVVYELIEGVQVDKEYKVNYLINHPDYKSTMIDEIIKFEE